MGLESKEVAAQCRQTVAAIDFESQLAVGQ